MKNTNTYELMNRLVNMVEAAKTLARELGYDLGANLQIQETPVVQKGNLSDQIQILTPSWMPSQNALATKPLPKTAAPNKARRSVKTAAPDKVWQSVKTSDDRSKAVLILVQLAREDGIDSSELAKRLKINRRQVGQALRWLKRDQKVRLVKGTAGKGSKAFATKTPS